MAQVLLRWRRSHGGHVWQHKMYICEFCGYETQFSANLKRHRNARHKDELPDAQAFKCPLCDYITYAKGQLKSHMDRMHKVVDAPEIQTSEASAPIQLLGAQSHVGIWRRHLLLPMERKEMGNNGHLFTMFVEFAAHR